MSYVRIYKPGGGLVRRGGGVSPQKKSGALAGRLGVRPGIACLVVFIFAKLVLGRLMVSSLQHQQEPLEMQEARLEEARSLTPGLSSCFSWIERMMLVFFPPPRDVLAAKGKGLDARQKLERMRNLKVRIET